MEPPADDSLLRAGNCNFTWHFGAGTDQRHRPHAGRGDDSGRARKQQGAANHKHHEPRAARRRPHVGEPALHAGDAALGGGQRRERRRGCHGSAHPRCRRLAHQRQHQRHHAERCRKPGGVLVQHSQPGWHGAEHADTAWCGRLERRQPGLRRRHQHADPQRPQQRLRPSRPGVRLVEHTPVQRQRRYRHPEKRPLVRLRLQRPHLRRLHPLMGHRPAELLRQRQLVRRAHPGQTPRHYR